MVFKRNFAIPAILFSVILGVLSHPTVLFGTHFPDLHLLAFVAYIPLFLVVLGKDLSVQLKRAFLFGLLYYLGSMYWLYTAMNTFGHLNPVYSVLALLIMCAAHAVYFVLPFFFSHFLKSSSKIPPFWSLPILWVSFDWMRGHWPLGGMPWVAAGDSQAPWITLIQISELTGVFGVTVLVVWSNLALVELIQIFRKKISLPKGVPRLAFVMILFAIALGFGVLAKTRVTEAIAKAPHLSMTLLQGNISQGEKWLASQAQDIHKIYRQMTQEALAQGVDLVLWPEASFPYDINLNNPPEIHFVGDFPKNVVVGAVTYLPNGLPLNHSLKMTEQAQVYNSVFLLRPGGELGDVYHKQHLVPYGEYIALKSVLPFLRTLTDEIGEFTPGDNPVILNAEGVHMGPLICYEDIFPEIARGHTRSGANLLINLTNDAWFGDSSALLQHLYFSPFRSVENRRSLVRATNNGLTASIDPLGRIRKTIPPYERGTLTDEVSLVTLPTFYAKWGDVFVFACMIVSGGMVLVALIRKVRT